MCGFLGEVSYLKKISDRSKFVSSAKILSHRGPDNFQYFSDGSTIQLGFNRLAIFDTSTKGNQPMTDVSGRFTIVFNGAIYNFKEIYEKINGDFTWYSNSDTEVLLNAWSKWGSECLKEIDGMFSFAIWDKTKKKIFLCRDRIGEKPLYYFIEDSYVAFSSRPRPLIKLLPEKLGAYDFSSINYYLESGHFPRNQSFYSNIKKLEPGTFIEISVSEKKVKSFWNVNDSRYKNKNNNNLLNNVDELENILKNSIKKIVQSDRPVGFFLSGGIDSSLIVSIASIIKPIDKINAFNLSFDNPQYDESEDAKIVAKENNINLKIKKLNHIDLIKNLDNFYETFDEPFADPACFPLMELSKFSKSYVDVAITGDGGDELFGGYDYYRISKIFGDLNYSKYITIITKLMKMIRNNHQFNLLYEASKNNNPIKFFSFLRSYKKDFSSVLIDEEKNIHNKSLYHEFENSMKNLNIYNVTIDEFMILDILHVLNDSYLQKTDLSTMAYSIESRAPFLNKETIEWAININVNQKVNSVQKKIILRELAKKYLPKEIVNKKKKGFEMPIKEWLRNELFDWSKDLIFDKENYTNLPLDMIKIKKIFELHQSKKRDCHPYLWAILMLLQFNRKNKYL